MRIKEAQGIVRNFTIKNSWRDEPNIDKFDHLHEELVEMSKHLRYKDAHGRKNAVKDRKEVFEDGIGDLLFGLFRLANQLGVDAEAAFEKASREIIKKYDGKKTEEKFIKRK